MKVGWNAGAALKRVVDVPGLVVAGLMVSSGLSAQAAPLDCPPFTLERLPDEMAATGAVPPKLGGCRQLGPMPASRPSPKRDAVRGTAVEVIGQDETVVDARGGRHVIGDDQGFRPAASLPYKLTMTVADAAANPPSLQQPGGDSTPADRVSSKLAKEERYRRLLSRDFAEQSKAELARGQRDAALMLALRGLPSNPREEDFQIFRQAADALFEAAATRIVRLPDVIGRVVATIHPNGTTMAIGSDRTKGTAQETELAFGLYDTADGKLIAHLRPFSQTHHWAKTYGNGPWFSADGKLLALMSLVDSRISVFDGQTGQLVRDLAELLLPDPKRYSGVMYPLGFSPDDRYFAAVSNDELAVWEAQSGKLVHRSRPGNGVNPFVFCYAWTFDNNIICSYQAKHGKAAVSPVVPKVHKLVLWSFGGYKDFINISDYFDTSKGLFSAVPRPSPYGPHVLLSSDAGAVVFDMSGKKIGEFASDPLQVVCFGPDGKTIETFPYDGSPDQLRLFALDGTELSVPVHRRARYLHKVFGKDGNRLGIANISLGFTSYGYQANDVPQGKALYDQIWAHLSPSRRAEVEADRVP